MPAPETRPEVARSNSGAGPQDYRSFSISVHGGCIVGRNSACNGHPSPAEDPGPAHPVGVSLHRVAVLPCVHMARLSLLSGCSTLQYVAECGTARLAAYIPQGAAGTKTGR